MAEGRRTGPRHYWGLHWESPPGDEKGPPRCPEPECWQLMVKMYIRRRFYLQNRRKWIWSGFWFCPKCESINTAGSFGQMKYESDHYSPEWPDYPDEYDFDED